MLRLFCRTVLFVTFALSLSACRLVRISIPTVTVAPSVTLSPTAFLTPTPGGSPLPESSAAVTETAPTLTSTPPPTRTFTITPTRTHTPTVTLTPTVTRTPTNTSTATLTPTLNPKAIQLRIAEPGPMSKVTSPIDFIFYISPDFVGDTRIELIAEDGRSLYSKGFRTFATEGSTKVTQKIDFEIPGPAETARLQVSTFDKFGHMLALNSVRVMLLSIGEMQLNPPYRAEEHVLLRKPHWDDEVSGGNLSIEGEIQALTTQPIIVELSDAAGNILVSQMLTLGPPDGKYQPFSIVLPYTVTGQKTLARLILRQADDRMDGLAYFFSREIYISP